MAKGKLKKKVKDAVDKAKGAVKGATTTVKTKVKKIENELKSAGNAKLLIPIKPEMVAILKAKGYTGFTLKTPIDEVATAFYNGVVLGRQHFNFESVDEENAQVGGAGGRAGAESDSNPTLIATAGATVAKTQGVPISPEIVQQIFDYVAKLISKKARGEKLTDEEKKLANKGQDVLQAVKDSEDEKSDKPDVWAHLSEWWWAYLAVLIILAIIAKKKGWI